MLPAFGALFRGGGNGPQSLDLLFESLAGNRAGIHHAAVSRSDHQGAIGVASRLVRLGREGVAGVG